MKALAVLLLVALPVGSPLAAVPDPLMSEVPDCIPVSPDGGLAYTVVVNDEDGIPCPGVLVEIFFDATANGMVSWCTGAAGPYFAAVTVPPGVATFFLEGGGCILGPTLAACGAPFAAEVFADGVLLEAVGCVNSPDAVTADGSLPSCPPAASICEGGMTVAGLSDAVFHTGPIAGGTVSLCSDFSGPVFGDAVGLADAVAVTAYLVFGLGCPCP